MDTSNDKTFYSTVLSKYSFIAFAGGIGMCMIIKPFMDVYVQSESYGEVWRYVPLLISSAVFSALAAYCGSMYSALKISINNMLSTLSAALINIVVNYLAIKAFGIWGAMIGTIVAYIVLAFVRIIDIRRFVDIQIKWDKLIPNSFLLLLQTIVVSFSSFKIGFVISVIVLLAFLLLNREELLWIKTQLRKRGK
jgi:O-antigen/teichoic acid export membrane protein